MPALFHTFLSVILFGFFAPGFHAQPVPSPSSPPVAEAPAPPAAPDGASPEADNEQPPQRPRATELAPTLGWLNTDRPLRFSDELKGQVVVLDFWTSYCINCMHTVEDLRVLETKYADQPVVFIGVHSAKFTTEAQRSAIRAAVQRYHITHPVVIDDHMALWQAYGIQGWPSFVIIGPDGLILARTSGEGRRDMLDAAIRNVLEYGRKNKTLAEAPFHHVPDAAFFSTSGLNFPGKVCAVAPTPGDGPDARGWLFIADSSNNRVIAATWPDAEGRSEVVNVVGGVGPKLVDGPPLKAAFHAPQGLAYDARRAELYIADTRNHAVRALSTRDWSVRTLAGSGDRGTDLDGGKSGRDQPLASPWDLALAPDGKSLAVAMAGSHQLWTIDLDSGVARRAAGAGGEALFDGPAADAALAQPSGLTFSPSGERLYFVDAESSSLRVLDFERASPARVRTLVGHDLFVFGDGDGPVRRAQLQHPLGVTLFNPGTAAAPGDESLLLADTFNHSLRLVDGAGKTITTWIGRPSAESDEAALALNEPGGVCVAGTGPDRRAFVADTNNHRVVMIDAATKAWREVTLSGLRPAADVAPRDAAEIRDKLALAPGKDARLLFAPPLGAGEHVNGESPITLVVREPDAAGRSGAIIAQRTVRADRFPVSIAIPAGVVEGGRQIVAEMAYTVCTDGANATCRPRYMTRLVVITPGTETSATLR